MYNLKFLPVRAGLEMTPSFGYCVPFRIYLNGTSRCFYIGAYPGWELLNYNKVNNR